MKPNDRYNKIHFWLSPANAQQIAGEIEKGVSIKNIINRLASPTPPRPTQILWIPDTHEKCTFNLPQSLINLCTKLANELGISRQILLDYLIQHKKSK